MSDPQSPSTDSSTFKSARPRERGEGMKNPFSMVPPHSVEAEQGLLAACLAEGGPEVLNACVEAGLQPEAFYRPTHQIVFAALLELQKNGQNPDEIVLADRLVKSGQIEEVGGYAGLEEITSRVQITAGALQWLEIVREKWLLRRLIRTSTTVVERAYQQEGELDSFLNDVESEVFAVSEARIRDQAVHIEESVDEATRLIEKMLRGGGQIAGVTTGFADLDKMTFGLHAQEMVVLAARPSMGKSTFGLNVAEAAVLPRKEGMAPTPTLFFSLEMGADQLALRMLCAHARVSAQKIKDGMANKEEQRALSESTRVLKKAPLWLDDTGHLTIHELRAKARRMVRQNGIGLVIVDYLQLLAPTDGRIPREQQISEMSRGLKAMAKELKVPVIVLAQLNRENEKENRAPRASDLRESGSIEQDADVILLLDYRKSKRAKEAFGDEEVDPSAPQRSHYRNLIVAKQRNGPVGNVDLTFLPQLTRFENFIAEDAG